VTREIVLKLKDCTFACEVVDEKDGFRIVKVKPRTNKTVKCKVCGVEMRLEEVWRFVKMDDWLSWKVMPFCSETCYIIYQFKPPKEG